MHDTSLSAKADDNLNQNFKFQNFKTIKCCFQPLNMLEWHCDRNTKPYFPYQTYTPQSHHYWLTILPDSAVGAIRVQGSYSSNKGTSRWIFIYIHNVVIHGKYRRLVHISNNYSQWCGILKWPQVKEAVIQVSVGAFNTQCVNLPLLIVERLRMNQRAIRATQVTGKLP